MKVERSEAEGTHMERHRFRTEELVASHDTVKLLKVEARRTNLISMALSGKDDDVIKVRSCKRFHRSSSCNMVVDMSMEVQRQEPMVSSNRSRENDYDSLTTNSSRSQC